MAYPVIECPKCSRKLAAEAEFALTDDSGTYTLPVYSCPECIKVPASGFGAGLELPLTFCVDRRGRFFDPADPDGELHL